MECYMAIKTLPFDAAEYLTDEESIADFLNASAEMGDPAVLLNALGTVARARSMTKLADDSGLGRESLYKALKPGAQPRYDTVMKVLGALGVTMVFAAQAKPTSAAKAVVRQKNEKKAATAPRKVQVRRPATEARAVAKDESRRTTRAKRTTSKTER
jgi:probable addiction module antidote protein